MNSNKFILILGLLFILILSVGSITAADADDSLSDSDLIDSVDNSNIDEVSAVDTEIDALINSPEKTKEDASLQSNSLASTISFNEKSYTTYFNKSGNIISGKLKSGDTLDFSGKFTKKTFVINIPLTITSTDGSANLVNCNFNIVDGAQGTVISNLDLTSSLSDTPLINVYNVSRITVSDCNIVSEGSRSYPILFNTVNQSYILNNNVHTTCYIEGWGQASAIVLSDTYNNTISNNYVVTNDSNGIYLTGYLNGGSMGQGGGTNLYNCIYNNTVHSLRGIEWAVDEDGETPLPSSFVYGIQVMGAYNDIINNTVYNAYRGISTTQVGNKIIGNRISNIHGTWNTGSTEEQGGDYAIYASAGSIVKDNVISDSPFYGTKGAISAGKGSVISNNVLDGIIGTGIVLSGDNVTISGNELYTIGDGIYISENYSYISIDNNFINSADSSGISMVKASRTKSPHDISIINNTISSSNENPIYQDDTVSNVTLSDNNIIENKDIYIFDDNFYDYFLDTNYLNNKVKENDTLVFVGKFASKGKIYINNRVTIQSWAAEFTDTTFVILDNDIVIEGIVINNPNKDNKDRMWGIQLNGVSNVTVQNCHISIFDENSAYAIYLLDSTDCNIINNNLEAKGNYLTAAIMSFNSNFLKSPSIL